MRQETKVISWSMAITLICLAVYLGGLHHKWSVLNSLATAIAVLLVIAVVAGRANTDRNDISAGATMFAIFGAVLSLMVTTMPDLAIGSFNRSATLVFGIVVSGVYVALTPWVARELKVRQKVVLGLLFFQALSVVTVVTFGARFT